MPSITNYNHFKMLSQNQIPVALKKRSICDQKNTNLSVSIKYSRRKKVCLDMNPNAKTPGKSVNLLLSMFGLITKYDRQNVTAI